MFLKDIGEVTYGRGQGGTTVNIIGGQTQGGTDGGYISLKDEDMELLADFEEELYRKGHFELLFPVAKTVDDYRGFFSQ